MTRGEMAFAREDWRKLRALSLTMPDTARAARDALTDAELDYAVALGAELGW